MRTAAIVLIVVLFPTLAAAQSGNERKAEQHFNAAQKLYNDGNYDGAVKEFLKAYTLVPANPLLFNIGQAYRLSGEKAKALAYYEKYVTFEPKGAQVPEAQDHIRTLREEIETEKREREALENQRRKADEERRQEEERKRAEELARERREAHERGSGLRTAGLVVGGVGIAAVGVGVALAAGAGKLDGKAAAVGGVGVAALVTGGVLYYLGVRERSNAEAAVGKTSMIVPSVTERSVGIAYIATF